MKQSNKSRSCIPFQKAISALLLIMALTANSVLPVSARSNLLAPIEIRWFIGLGTGSDPAQVTVEQAVADAFNALHPDIHLTLEVVDFASARDTLASEFAAGNGPDIVGPVGWAGANAFYGQWLDLAPLIASTGFDTSVFDPALVQSYNTEEGQIGLPFAVYPGAMYYVPALFDAAGLNYPPQVYGQKYVMPDSSQVDWSWDTVAQIAKLLTLDGNGKNSTEAGFDRNNIVQVGYNPQWQSIQSIGTFYQASKIYAGGPGSYVATIPDAWKVAWKWYYDGMWGAQPFIPTGPLANTPEFGAGNVFSSGKAAMALTQIWYVCCLFDFKNAGREFQLGIQPSYQGVVHGRIDADTFRISKDSAHPDQAFTVMTYLIGNGADSLLPAYGGMPAIASKVQAFFDQKALDYPFVTAASWNVFKQGLAYPDAPSAEGYMPNYNQGNGRLGNFSGLLSNTPGLSLDHEVGCLQADLTAIFNNQAVPASCPYNIYLSLVIRGN